MTDTNDISNVQDANCKDDSDMDDIEIELEIHVSPKKPASADKPTALSNHGGEKSQIVQSSKSSIRYFVVNFFIALPFLLNVSYFCYGYFHKINYQTLIILFQ